MLKFFGYAFLFIVMAAAVRPAQAQITGSNWTGTFYNNTTLSDAPVATETYPDGLYYNWADGPPMKADYVTPVPGVNADNFSARFTSTQTFALEGTYTFTIYVDDGMRLFFDDVLILDQFNANPTPDFRIYTFDYPISGGAQIDMRVEYIDLTGSARISLQWGRRTALPFIMINTPYDGETVNSDYAPTFSWQDAGAPSYLFKLWSDGGSLLLKGVYPAAGMCDGETCSLDSGALPGGAGIKLENDEYAWQVKTRGTAGKRKSAVIEFAVSFPARAQNLTPDFNAIVSSTSPLLSWSDVAPADQYKIVLTRIKNGAKIKIGWLQDSAFGCDGMLCTLDPAALERPIVLKRGKYKWRVFARNTALKASISKSSAARFKVVPDARISPLPPPEAPAGFRAP